MKLADQGHLPDAETISCQFVVLPTPSTSQVSPVFPKVNLAAPPEAALIKLDHYCAA